MNEEMKKLSHTLVHYSLKIKENDRVQIVCGSPECRDFVKYLIKEITDQKAIPFVDYFDPETSTFLNELTTKKRAEEVGKHRRFEVDHYDCFISIRYLQNDYESKNVPAEVKKWLGEATEEANDIRINQRRWVLLNYPSHLDAFKAKMTTSDYVAYAWRVMNVDYAAMDKDIAPLKKLMEETDEVHMVGPGTDLTFSIKGMPAIPCCGISNIPDGEIYTAPVRESVQGTLTYNTPCSYQGNVFTGVQLTFENGKIVKATCNEDNDALNAIFDIDEGARYIGEFSFGLNPEIREPMGDILFDEKIIGSIHFTPGRCYEDANNENKSSVHWDMIWVQRKEYGGGDVYFDGKLIRKDGIFVLPELQHLNYDLK